MSKKFIFKLNPVLKLRHFKEETIKLELGQIVSELNALKNKLSELDHNIDMGHQEIERLSSTTIIAAQIKFYPMYFSGIYADIEKHKKLLLLKEEEYNICLAKLAAAMGEVKVFEKLKEKEKNIHKKNIEKKQNMESEERFQGQRYYHLLNKEVKDGV
jgi:flagellar export protein FliJ